MQLGLFGQSPPGFDPRFAKAARVELGGGAYLEHVPAWLEGHQAVFDVLLGTSEWHAHERLMYERRVAVPRLMASPAKESSVRPLLSRMAAALSARFGGVELSSWSVALYRDGKDSVAFHGDKMGALIDDCVIAIVSVGAPRRFLLRPKKGTPDTPERRALFPNHQSLSFNLGWGDLLVMGGPAQRDFEHGVPKLSHAEPRIAIMFRPAYLDRTSQAKTAEVDGPLGATEPQTSAAAPRYQSRVAKHFPKFHPTDGTPVPTPAFGQRPRVARVPGAAARDSVPAQNVVGRFPAHEPLLQPSRRSSQR
jgi:alkylated DNA repair dioxygenase AlkB